jgi:hypothetical protein
MLLQPSGLKKSKALDLPLDTPEQMEHSMAVDAALERRTDREMKEVALERAAFNLLAEKIVFALGVIAFVVACVLWIGGAGLIVVSGFGGSGAGAVLMAVSKLTRSPVSSPTPWVSQGTPDIKGER